MYTRRKVFSLLEVEGEERLFSTTDINLVDAEERLFSINEDALELEQRDFSEGEGLSKSDVAKIGAAAAAAALGVYGMKKGGKYIRKSAIDTSRRVSNASSKGQLSQESIDTLKKAIDKKIKVANVMEAPADFINKAAKNVKKAVSNMGKKKK